ncbi:MAG: FAD:protein FMN transferase, partial [Acidimicrobiia bacterium]
TSMIAMGYDRTFTAIEPRASAATTLRRTPGCGSIRVDRGLRAVGLPAGVSIDPGGIGKGLAADIVAGELLDRGALAVCVSVGGDVRAAHRPDAAHPWRIGLADPSDPTRLFGVASLAVGAVVTSSTLTRRWSLGDEMVHHVIDPRTGAPMRSDLVAVTVVAGEAWWAEVLAKWVLAAGETAGIELLERRGATGLVVRSDGTAVMLGGMRSFLSEPELQGPVTRPQV